MKIQCNTVDDIHEKQHANPNANINVNPNENINVNPNEKPFILKGKRNKFNEDQFNRYDPPARDKIREKLDSFVIDNPDKFKQDFIITDENCKYKYLEIQVCASWFGQRFPFEKVFVYERKSVYDYDTLFITLNKNLTRGYIFDAKSFKDSEPRRLKKYCREFVYDVPWHRIIPFEIDCLDKELIMNY